jgi:hypothetical protein
MFYNTKIKLLFVIICILQHIFNQYPNFIDLCQKSRSFLLHFGEYFVRFCRITYKSVCLPQKILFDL